MILLIGSLAGSGLAWRWGKGQGLDAAGIRVSSGTELGHGGEPGNSSLRFYAQILSQTRIWEGKDFLLVLWSVFGAVLLDAGVS